MASENIPRAGEKKSAPASEKNDTESAGGRVDWLTKELGRRPTWEERLERARAAAAELGVPPPPPHPPIRQRTPEEHAAMVAQTNRIREAIRKELGPWRFNSTKFIRDMRDGNINPEPDAYWRKVENAGH